MKGLIRAGLQACGLYEAASIGVARAKGLPRGISVRRAGDTFRIRDRHGRAIFLNHRHAVYVSDMVEYFDFYYSAVLPGDSQEVHYEKAAWHVLPGRQEPLFFTSYAESTETPDLYLRRAAVEPGDVILDVGAYCGLTSVVFAEKVGPDGRVYAFEPDPENFAALATNKKSLGLENLIVENAAVWKEAGTLEFQSDGTPGARVGAVSDRADSQVKVAAVTLQDYVRTRQIGRINLLKLDVEGAEADILSASRDVLAIFRPFVIVELHPVHDVWTTDACLSVLRADNYETEIVPQPGTHCPLLFAKPRASH